MISESDRLFIKLLADHLNEQPSPDVSCDQRILSLAAAHQVEGILYHQTRWPNLKAAHAATLYRYANRNQLLTELCTAFDGAAIDYYLVKGVPISTCYSVPALRTMGDCDIQVHGADRLKAREIFLAQGYDEDTAVSKESEWLFSKSGYEFELHHALLYDDGLNKNPEHPFVERAWDHVTQHRLDVNFHFVYLLIHLKKHLIGGGIGIRPFMDLAVMAKQLPLDPEIISADLALIGLEKFAGICAALCERWFEILLPVVQQPLSESFFERVTNFILTNGLYGHTHPDREANAMRNELMHKSRWRCFKELFFPDYQTCRQRKEYTWIEGRPLCLPILWVIRLVGALRSGKGKVGGQRMQAIVFGRPNSDFLEGWGL